MSAWLTTNETGLVAAQQAALALDGKFRQVLSGNIKPSHRSVALQFTIPAEAVIDEYVGPRGKGWILTFHADDAGSRFSLAKDYGDEGRTRTWAAE